MAERYTDPTGTISTEDESVVPDLFVAFNHSKWVDKPLIGKEVRTIHRTILRKLEEVLAKKRRDSAT